MMDLQQFDKIPHGEIFAKGEIVDSPLGINMMNTGNQLRWIAKKGDGNDWAIYCHWTNFSDEYIAQSGEKVRNIENIQKLVSCTMEVLKLYRQ